MCPKTKYAVSKNGDQKEKLALAFEVYDIKKTGYLDESDLEIVVIQMMKIISDCDEIADTNTMVKICFKLLVCNDNGWVSKEEFIDGLLENYNLRILMSPFN